MCARHIFPQQLHVILNDPLLADIICWLPTGDAFVILRSDQLCSQVLPHYFSPKNSLKYSSFKRKMNRWGFQQIRTGPYIGAFHHPLFKRYQQKLCLYMDCRRAGASKNCGKMTNLPTVFPDNESIGISSSHPISAGNIQLSLPPESSLNISSPLSCIIQDSITKFQLQRMSSCGNNLSNKEDKSC